MQAVKAPPVFDPAEERIAAPRLLRLGLQHVLVSYAGAIAVPLIVGRALQLSLQDVAFLISADLLVCGIVSALILLIARHALGFIAPAAVLPGIIIGGLLAAHAEESH